MNRPGNPYTAGNPIGEPAQFFGRQDIRNWVIQELKNQNTNSLVLHGQRRIGKTSLLLYLQQTLPDDLFFPVYFDLQDQATQPLKEVLAELADMVAIKTVKKFSSIDFDDKGHVFRSEFLPSLYQELKDSCRPVFLIDELDVLDQEYEHMRLPETAAAKSLYPFLTRTMSEDRRPAFIFTIGRSSDDLSDKKKNMLRIAASHLIWLLDRKSTEKLIRQAEKNNTLRFTAKAVERIINLTNRHPFLTQLLCQRIWDQAYPETLDGIPQIDVSEVGTLNGIPQIDVSEVEDAVPDALKVGAQALEWLWSGLSLAEKIYLAALAAIADEGEYIDRALVIKSIADHAARLHMNEIILAPRELKKRNILERKKGYRFTIDIFRRWVAQNKYLDNIKDELDETEPEANHLYEIGRQRAFLKQWSNSVISLQEALEKNPNHFRARLHLGEALCEMGRIDEAIGILEQAYKLDKNDSHFLLLEVLKKKTEIQKKSDDEDGILAVCNRILEIAPEDEFAQEQKRIIWTCRGDIDLEQNNLKAALAYYQKAGIPERITLAELLQELTNPDQSRTGFELWTEAVEFFNKLADESDQTNWRNMQETYRQIINNQLFDMEKEAREFMQKKQWSQTAAIYVRLTIKAIDSNSKEIWQKALYRCEQESKLSQDFDEGLKAKEQGEWQKARAVFLDVIRHHITYQKNGIRATELLDQIAKESPEPILPHPLPFFKPNLPISVENVTNIEQIVCSDEIPSAVKVVYSLNGELLAVTSRQGICILDPQTLARIGFIKTHAWVESLAFSPDSKTLAFGMHDGTIQLHQVKDGNLCCPLLNEHSKAVNSIVFSPDGETLISAGDDRTVYFWQVATGALEGILEKDIGRVWDIAFSPDGEILCLGSVDGIIRLLQVHDMNISHTLAEHNQSVWNVCFSPDGSTLASASSDSTARVWDTESGNVLFTLKAHKRPVNSIAYSPDGTILASGSKDKTLCFWKTDNGNLLHTIPDFKGDVTSVDFSPDGTAITSVSNNRIVQLWGIRR